MPELSSDVDVGSFSSHCESDYQSSFHQFVRVASEDLSIFAGTRF